MSVMQKIKDMLIEEIQRKMQDLPFGFGQEEGIEGFPKWCVYIDKEGKLFGHPSLDNSFKEDLTVLENLSLLSTDKLTALAEEGLSGEALFKEMHDDYCVGNGMGGKAWQDAKVWKNTQKPQVKP